MESELVAKTSRYLQIAGDVAARMYANAEAIGYYHQALALGQSGGMSEELRNSFNHQEMD